MASNLRLQEQVDCPNQQSTLELYMFSSSLEGSSNLHSLFFQSHQYVSTGHFLYDLLDLASS